MPRCACGWEPELSARRVVLVTKEPLADRLRADELARLSATGAVNPQRLHGAAERHRTCLAAVRSALADHHLTVLAVSELDPEHGIDADLVVTVGGDGTVFTANTLRTRAPFLTVNSDPDTSVGHYTRAGTADVGALVDAWEAGTCRIEELPRLAVRIAGRTSCFLNDCLLSSANPAAMSRYVIDDGGLCEHQLSSGVWIATATGSTAAYRSAGGEPVPAGRSALLWRVREPFEARGRFRLLSGRQEPPRHLRLVAAIPGMGLWLDGPNISLPLPPGEAAEFHAAPDPLRLIARP